MSFGRNFRVKERFNLQVRGRVPEHLQPALPVDAGRRWVWRHQPSDSTLLVRGREYRADTLHRDHPRPGQFAIRQIVARFTF